MVCGSFKRNIDAFLPKKYQAKNSPDTEKMGDILDTYSTQQKRLASSERPQKTAYETLKQFFFYS